MKTIATLIIITLGFASGVMGQDQKAIDILNSVSDKTKAYKNFSADFTMSLVDLQSDIAMKKTGSIVVAGDKYRVKLDNDVVIGDGDNRWTFQSESNEVYVDYEATDEDNALNPSKLFTIWESGFKQYYDGAGEVKGRKTHQIKLHPVKPGDSSFHTVKVHVDSEKLELLKVEVMGKEGDNYTYELQSFKADQSIPAGTFAFEKSKFPGAEVIDLR